MNRRSILLMTTMLGLALLPSSAVSQQKSLKDQLVGTWTVASLEQVRPDGTKFQRYGANPKGTVIFDTNGRFALMFLHPELPKLASNNISTPTPEELKAMVGRSLAYYGTYSVDEGKKVIDLRIEASTFPNQVGREAKRTIVSLTADELKYSNPTPLTGGQINVAFRRAPAAPGF